MAIQNNSRPLLAAFIEVWEPRTSIVGENAVQTDSSCNHTDTHTYTQTAIFSPTCYAWARVNKMKWQTKNGNTKQNYLINFRAVGTGAAGTAMAVPPFWPFTEL